MLHEQLPYLGTSLIVGLGTVVLTVLLAAPAGYSLAKLRPRGGGVLSFVLLVAQMIPGDHHGDGLLRDLPQPRACSTRCRG